MDTKLSIYNKMCYLLYLYWKFIRTGYHWVITLFDAPTSVRSLVKILVRPVYVGGAGCEANAMLIASRFQVPNWDGWRVITFNSCYCKVL